MTITDASFASDVDNFDGVVLVDFWAEWCAPCRAIAPMLDEIAEEYKDNPKVKIAKLNVDENQSTAQRFGIMSIPNLVIFKNGAPAGNILGLQPKENIVAELKRVIEG
jgi:thioredoxin 1